MHKTKKHIVLHVISGDLWAGAESQVFNTLTSLNGRDDFLFFCVCFNQGILSKRLKESGIEVIIIDEGKLSSWTMLQKLAEILENHNPAIIHVHHIKEQFLSILAKVKSRSLVSIFRTMHGLSAVRSGLPWRKHLRTRFVVFIDRVMLRYYTDTIVSVSKDLSAYLKHSGVKGKICHIYNSLLLENHAKNEYENPLKIREKHGISKHAFWIGTAARLVDVKNLPLLIDMAKLLSSDNVDFQVSVFGEGRLRKSLEQVVESNDLLDNVHFHGFEKDIVPLINAFDVFVLCSKHEGLPMALLEAMLVRTPVVCSRVGGMSEIIENGINGFTFPSGDAREFRAAIDKIRLNDGGVPGMVEKAYDDVCTTFSSAVTSKKLCKLYYDEIEANGKY